MLKRPVQNQHTLERAPSQVKLAKLFAGLAERQMNTNEIAELICASKPTTRLYLQILRERGQIHIKKWDRPGNCPPVPVYALGPGKNAERPKALTHTETHRRHIAKLKRERPEEYDSRLARKRTRMRIARGGIKPDPLTAWIPRKAA